MEEGGLGLGGGLGYLGIPLLPKVRPENVAMHLEGLRLHKRRWVLERLRVSIQQQHLHSEESKKRLR